MTFNRVHQFLRALRREQPFAQDTYTGQCIPCFHSTIVAHPARLKSPVAACLACAGSFREDFSDVQWGCSPRPGTSKACRYWSTQATFQSPCIYLESLQLCATMC